MVCRQNAKKTDGIAQRGRAHNRKVLELSLKPDR